VAIAVKWKISFWCRKGKALWLSVRTALSTTWKG